MNSRPKSLQVTFLIVLFFMGRQLSSVSAQLPPPPPCDSTQDKFVFQMRTDDYGEDISWVVQIKEDGDFEEYFGRGALYGDEYDNNTLFQENYCFPKRDNCYRFIIFDSNGDGLCCSNNSGGYRIKFKGDILIESQFKDDELEVIKFGGCDNTSPTPTPISSPSEAEPFWMQIGGDINGNEFSSGRSGWSVSLSSDGKTVAIGAKSFFIGGETTPGYVRIFHLVDGSGVDGLWVQIGNDIDGEADNDDCGWSVSLSSDGNTVAVGAPKNDEGGKNSGHVRVFGLTDGSWIQIGDDIDGESRLDLSGESVSLSSDGRTVAIGADNNDGGGDNSGHARVFGLIDGSWIQIGNDIDGAIADDWFGASVSLSSDGNRVAIGAPYNDGNGSSSGHVRIFGLLDGSWMQIGNDIDGEHNGDSSGDAVSLSSNGETVAIGAKYNDSGGPCINCPGHVRVFGLVDGEWVQIGNDIDGEDINARFGWAVSLSSNGDTVAIGAPYSDGDSGLVKVFSLMT